MDNNISCKPWKIQHSRDALDTYRRYIVNNNDARICSMYHKDFNNYATCMPDAEYIIMCVNERDELINDSIRQLDEIERLNEDIKRLNELYANEIYLRKNIDIKHDILEHYNKTLESRVSEIASEYTISLLNNHDLKQKNKILIDAIHSFIYELEYDIQPTLQHNTKEYISTQDLINQIVKLVKENE